MTTPPARRTDRRGGIEATIATTVKATTVKATIEWRPSGSPGLAGQLVAEWQRLKRCPRTIARARALQLTPERFDDLDDLLRLAGFGVPTSPASDAVLYALAERAGGDDLAARILLQRILPGLLAVAARERRRQPDADTLADVVGEAWVAIRRYRSAARPTAIPARLLSDARHRAFTEPRRRRRVLTEPRDHDRLPEPAATAQHPFVELTALLDGARAAGLDEHDLITVRTLLAHDAAGDAATAAGITARAMRYRRRATVARLRAYALDCTAAEPGERLTLAAI